MKRLAIFLSFSGAGGVEKNILNLLPAFLEAGVAVDVLAILRKPTPELMRLDGSGMRVIDLGTRHSALSIPGLARYLRTERPDALLVAKDRAIRAAIIARRLSGAGTLLAGQLNTHLSASLAHKPAYQRWFRTAPMRWFYPHVDRVIAVSAGVAADTAALTGLPLKRIPVIRNPVVTPDLLPLSREPLDHPWFAEGECPVILSAGRLTRQKDFGTLIRAFAKLRERRPCRLMILGEGRQRAELEKLAAELNLEDSVALPGHVANPYPYMARSALFVLSSQWEGSGNVLTEAMALGTPVASTDCPSGPAEMLAHGQYGPLTPVGDADRLADAMEAVLDSPPDAASLQAAVADYTLDRSARRYLEVLGLVPASAHP